MRGRRKESLVCVCAEFPWYSAYYSATLNLQSISFQKLKVGKAWKCLGTKLHLPFWWTDNSYLFAHDECHNLCLHEANTSAMNAPVELGQRPIAMESGSCEHAFPVCCVDLYLKAAMGRGQCSKLSGCTH